MIGLLPTKLTAGGIEYEIRSDFRDILRIYAAFDDASLTDHEKAYIVAVNIFPDYEDIPEEHLQEAIEKAYWFIGGGDMPQSEPEKQKLIDWKQDENILFPAINKASGMIVRACEYLHWWEFLGFFGEIGEGLFSTVMNIRQKKAQCKPLEKHEKEFYKKNRNLVNIKTPEDIEAEEDLKQIIDALT